MANGESNTYINSSIDLSWDTIGILDINLFDVFLKKALTDIIKKPYINTDIN